MDLDVIAFWNYRPFRVTVVYGRKMNSNFKDDALQQRVSAYQMSGPDRDRTDDLLNAIQALSQLSYGPGKRPAAFSGIDNLLNFPRLVDEGKFRGGSSTCRWKTAVQRRNHAAGQVKPTSAGRY